MKSTSLPDYLAKTRALGFKLGQMVWQADPEPEDETARTTEVFDLIKELTDHMSLAASTFKFEEIEDFLQSQANTLAAISFSTRCPKGLDRHGQTNGQRHASAAAIISKASADARRK